MPERRARSVGPASHGTPSAISPVWRIYIERRNVSIKKFAVCAIFSHLKAHTDCVKKSGVAWQGFGFGRPALLASITAR